MSQSCLDVILDRRSILEFKEDDVPQDVLDKVNEEVEEVRLELTDGTPDHDKVVEEMGDLLFAVGRTPLAWTAAAFAAAFWIPFIGSANTSIWQSKVPHDIQGKVLGAAFALQPSWHTRSTTGTSCRNTACGSIRDACRLRPTLPRFWGDSA